MREWVADFEIVVKRPAEYRQITKEAQVKYLESLGLPPFLVTDMSEHLAAFEEFQGKVYHGPEVIQASEVCILP